MIPLARSLVVIDSRTRFLFAAALAFAGPAVIGALVGAQRGALEAVRLAGGVPAIVLGLTVMLVPALYVGTALTGGAPPAGTMGRMAARAMWACGVTSIALAAPLAFLLYTSQSWRLAVVLGGGALALAALAALRGFAGALADAAAPPSAPPGWAPSRRSQLVFGGWAITGLILGARLYRDLIASVA
jgi:hypothetical protein